MNNKDRIIQISPTKGFTLTDNALKYILDHGDQVSFTDFDGWLLKTPVYVQKRKNIICNSLLRADGTLYIILLNKRNPNKILKITNRIVSKCILKLQKIKFIEKDIYNPFPEFLPQLNLIMDPKKTTFIESPLFLK